MLLKVLLLSLLSRSLLSGRDGPAERRAECCSVTATLAGRAETGMTTPARRRPDREKVGARLSANSTAHTPGSAVEGCTSWILSRALPPEVEPLEEKIDDRSEGVAVPGVAATSPHRPGAEAENGLFPGTELMLGWRRIDFPAAGAFIMDWRRSNMLRRSPPLRLRSCEARGWPNSSQSRAFAGDRGRGGWWIVCAHATRVPARPRSDLVVSSSSETSSGARSSHSSVSATGKPGESTRGVGPRRATGVFGSSSYPTCCRSGEDMRTALFWWRRIGRRVLLSELDPDDSPNTLCVDELETKGDPTALEGAGAGAANGGKRGDASSDTERLRPCTALGMAAGVSMGSEGSEPACNSVNNNSPRHTPVLGRGPSFPHICAQLTEKVWRSGLRRGPR